MHFTKKGNAGLAVLREHPNLRATLHSSASAATLLQTARCVVSALHILFGIGFDVTGGETDGDKQLLGNDERMEFVPKIIVRTRCAHCTATIEMDDIDKAVTDHMIATSF